MTQPEPADQSAAVWIDGDPRMEAAAAAVWEQCLTQGSIVVDDPRNIAAVAVTAIRAAAGMPVPATNQAGCPDPIECSHEAALGQALARVERLALAFQVSGNEFIADQIRTAAGEQPAERRSPADGQQKTRLLTKLRAGLTPIADEAQLQAAESERENIRLRTELRVAREGLVSSQTLTEHYRKRAEANASSLGTSWDEIKRLRAELEQARGAALREAADDQDAKAACDVIGRHRNIATGRRLVAIDLRRMADEAQQAGHRLPGTTETP